MDWVVALGAGLMVVSFYPQRVNTRTPAFGRAFGRTTITAHDSPCRVLPDGRQAEAWTTDRSLRDPLLHQQAANSHPLLMLAVGGRTRDHLAVCQRDGLDSNMCSYWVRCGQPDNPTGG